MAQSSRDITNSQGKRHPKAGTPITVRLQDRPLADMDQWRRQQPDIPTRAEAIRRAVEAFFKS